jgi:hypothetical protein
VLAGHQARKGNSERSPVWKTKRKNRDGAKTS